MTAAILPCGRRVVMKPIVWRESEDSSRALIHAPSARGGDGIGVHRPVRVVEALVHRARRAVVPMTWALSERENILIRPSASITCHARA